ncbi:uncharacterized protein SCHCODRAFT_02595116 [Schizophyllum commune H4-8]|nr:uncharacterized protein SCHCODRAFT_02595116 [Schizophyllum commune H4-8]KAI5836638.1 hypothetical protein SCHCODRAFT_02595116 [Schizophyllum commune H4-8]
MECSGLIMSYRRAHPADNDLRSVQRVFSVPAYSHSPASHSPARATHTLEPLTSDGALCGPSGKDVQQVRIVPQFDAPHVHTAKVPGHEGPRRQAPLHGHTEQAVQRPRTKPSAPILNVDAHVLEDDLVVTEQISQLVKNSGRLAQRDLATAPVGAKSADRETSERVRVRKGPSDALLEVRQRFGGLAEPHTQPNVDPWFAREFLKLCANRDEDRGLPAIYLRAIHE